MSSCDRSRRDPVGSRPRAALAALSVLAAVALAVPQAAAALEKDPNYDWGPRTPFIFYPGVDERTATVPGLPPTATAGGIDVIGDSISTAVPYVARGAQDGVRVDVRSWGGWNIRFHRSVTGWSDTGLTSVERAVTDDQRAVVVQLGTNDIYCLRADEACPATPPDDDPGAAAFVQAGRAAIAAQVQALADRLLAAGKCVVWAGPRAGRSLRATDVAFFDGLLADLEAAHPGRLRHVRWEDEAAVIADFAAQGSDGIHPRSAAARAAIADALIGAAVQGCGLDATPPDATMDAGPAPVARERAPSFGFSARQGRVSFRCRVDAGPPGPCTSPVTLAPQGDGRHIFAVLATNAAGVSDRTPVVRAFTVDTTGPVAAFVAPPSLTRLVSPTLSFASLPDGDAATWACRVDDSPPVPCRSPFVPPPLADGAHVFRVAGQDALGNPGAAIAAALRVDTQPPRLTAGPQTVRVDRWGRGRVRMACRDIDGHCDGSLVVRSATALGHRIVRFATARVTVKAGGRRDVRFRLSPAALPILMRRGGASVTVTAVVSDAAGNTATTVARRDLRPTTPG